MPEVVLRVLQKRTLLRRRLLMHELRQRRAQLQKIVDITGRNDAEKGDGKQRVQMHEVQLPKKVLRLL